MNSYDYVQPIRRRKTFNQQKGSYEVVMNLFPEKVKPWYNIPEKINS
jgi:hypothetical protein